MSMLIYLCASCGRLRQTHIYHGGKFVCPECFKKTGICKDKEDIATLDFLAEEERLLSSLVQKSGPGKNPVPAKKLSDCLEAL